MSTPRFVEQESLDACTGSPFCKPWRHNIRDVKGKLVRNQAMSPEFVLKYIEWRKSRVAMLDPTRKRDRGWYESVTGIWSQWILEGVVENDNIPSMRTLAHIYDAIKDRPPNLKGSTGKAMPPRAAMAAFKHDIKFQKLIDFFCPQQLAARGRRPTSQPRSARRKICSTPSTATLHRQAQSCELRGQAS